MHRFIAAAFALALCGCTANTVSSLHYAPTVPVQPVSVATVGGVTATDQRKEAPNRIATIMGGYGNPLKTLDTAKPLKDEVADAFGEGLRARGLLTANDQAPFHLALTIRRFDSDRYMGRGARIDLTMAVIDKAGRTVFEDAAKDEESESAFAESGIFGKIEALQRLCEVVLDRSVDKLLDSPGFRAAVTHPSGAGR
jgi:ABC-type uncharacterized transport system auxiliary subunit